jgi:hypothetical protein
LKDDPTDCYQCVHRRDAGHNTTHSACAKPDPDMTGHPHGIKKGWFQYPRNFDPVWKTRPCANFEARPDDY